MAEMHDRGSEWEPVTDAERDRAAEAVARLRADLALAADQPEPPGPAPERLTGPIGLDRDGNLQPPLTPEEIARYEAARRAEWPPAS